MILMHLVQTNLPSSPKPKLILLFHKHKSVYIYTFYAVQQKLIQVAEAKQPHTMEL